MDLFVLFLFLSILFMIALMLSFQYTYSTRVDDTVPEYRASLLLEGKDKDNYIQSIKIRRNEIKKRYITRYGQLVLIIVLSGLLMLLGGPIYRVTLVVIDFFIIVIGSHGLLSGTGPSMSRYGWFKVLEEHNIDISNYIIDGTKIGFLGNDIGENQLYPVIQSFLKENYPENASFHQSTDYYYMLNKDTFTEEQLDEQFPSWTREPIIHSLVKDLRKIGLLERDYRVTILNWLFILISLSSFIVIFSVGRIDAWWANLWTFFILMGCIIICQERVQYYDYRITSDQLHAILGYRQEKITFRTYFLLVDKVQEELLKIEVKSEK